MKKNIEKTNYKINMKNNNILTPIIRNLKHKKQDFII